MCVRFLAILFYVHGTKLFSQLTCCNYLLIRILSRNNLKLAEESINNAKHF